MSLAWHLYFCVSLCVSQQDTMSACQRASCIAMSLPVSEVHALISVKCCTTPSYSPCVYGKLSEAHCLGHPYVRMNWEVHILNFTWFCLTGHLQLFMFWRLLVTPIFACFCIFTASRLLESNLVAYPQAVFHEVLGSMCCGLASAKRKWKTRTWLVLAGPRNVCLHL